MKPFTEDMSVRGQNGVHIEQRGPSGLRAFTGSLKLDLDLALALEDVFLVCFSTGGGAVARYVGRHDDPVGTIWSSSPWMISVGQRRTR